MEAMGNKGFARGYSAVDGDDLLDFSLDVEGDKKDIIFLKGHASGGLSSLPAEEEEELEWLSNKDAFPAVEFDILDEKPETKLLEQHSPVSVLESVIINGKRYERSGFENRINRGILQVPSGFPNFARKKRIGRKRRICFSQNKRLLLVGHEISVVDVRNYRQEPPIPPAKNVVRNGASTTVKRCCVHCGSEKTPQWRAGPMGPKTLCNACGVRYKSGRLVPEYRPASSPTFSSRLHSNSHRKIVEMRMLKQVKKTNHYEGDVFM